jgi:tetratricopeptide (TPR) repeat protein
MVDKKGQPSKNAAKSWYLRGLIYCAMDTTKKVQFQKLDPNPFAVAKEAFDKAKAIDSKSATFINGPDGFPLLTTQVDAILASNYFNKAITAYNEKTDDKDKKLANVQVAYENSERTLYFIPTDTTVLLYCGGVFAPMVGQYDRGLEMLHQYVSSGGTLPEAYTMMANIYTQNKKDNASALKILQEAKVKYPNYKDIGLMELNIYLSEKKYDLASQMVENDLKSDPTNSTNYFLYGQLNREMGQIDKAKDAFKKVLELDPKNFRRIGQPLLSGCQKNQGPDGKPRQLQGGYGKTEGARSRVCRKIENIPPLY